MVAEKSAVSGAHIAKHAADIRGRYFKHHPKYGSVFLKAKSAALAADIALLAAQIELHRERVRERFAREAEKSKSALVLAFWRAVQRNPPDDLLAQLPTMKPSMEEAKAYLAQLLDNAFPQVDKVCQGMSVRFVPKDLTWETLNEPGFVEWLGKQYLANCGLQKPFDLFRAAQARTGGPKMPEQGQLEM